MGRLIGYARTSTEDQLAGLEAQIRDLLAAGCTVIYREQVSSVVAREQLDLALADVGRDDTLVVTKPDRLARSTEKLLAVVRDLETRGIGLVVLSMGGERLDTRNPTSKLILTILAGVSAWEREIMLERQREGIAKARLDGKYKGRPRDRAAGITDSVYDLSDRKIPWPRIAASVGVSIRTVARIIKARNTNGFGCFADRLSGQGGGGFSASTDAA